MIRKWIQTVLGPRKVQAHLDSGVVSQNGAHPAAKIQLLDIAHEVLSKEAMERQAALKGFEKYGSPLVERQKRKVTIGVRIKRLLRLPLYAGEESDLVEEVTERIVEAAEVDPYYRRMFDGGEKNK